MPTYKMLWQFLYICNIKAVFVLVGFLYVDDTDLFQTGCSVLDVHISMEEIITSFGGVMEVTGAAISTDTSWYYLVDYTWKNGK